MVFESTAFLNVFLSSCPTRVVLTIAADKCSSRVHRGTQSALLSHSLRTRLVNEASSALNQPTNQDNSAVIFTTTSVLAGPRTHSYMTSFLKTAQEDL
ncbi:hypothetical protein LSTR_LSTR016983 [Laodelphax striatellus]|uniref:Uncharacterized protein n=1 Tax=Laodelphax striatellus TaxID=195883 RepID=A0A482WP35_LAOST|nr:hypothetical protein LSTR_LSTR016983 [Laodelphax striatellus]